MADEQIQNHTVVSGTVNVKMEDTGASALVVDLAKMLYANTNFENSDKSPSQLAQIAIARAIAFAECLKE